MISNATHGSLPHVTAVQAESDAIQSNTFFQNAQGPVNISGYPSFQNNVTNVYGGGTDDLKNLDGFISLDAQFDSSAQDPTRQCHLGTRENVLKRLRDWVDRPSSTERIFWLYGPAGAGKSAIAQTIARSYDRQKVPATFFFFRSDVNRNDGNRLFTTLAYQLALSIPEMRDSIVHSLSERPDLPKADAETQFKQLLAGPFHVLNEDATQQLSPAVHDIVKKYRALAPVIIIDGVDECSDDGLQRRFLKVISDAVADDRFPLRFLIVSRPEVHIEQTICRSQTPILRIDLAKLDDANRDIEKYLVDEFSRIASEQDLDSAWPGKEIIDDIVYKSSGNFIFASIVIKFVGDPYYFAKTQLEIVLNMKPPKTMSPFAILDQLFLEILRRVPDQVFLKRYLALLVARISVFLRDYDGLYKDDAVLMHVSEQELHVNLRRMRSLLKFEPGIDVHHKSFLDFLHDSSRSGEYYIHKQRGIKGYLKLFIDSLVRYVSTAIEQTNHHNASHFTPEFIEVIKWCPPKIVLPVNEWHEVMQPLLDLQDTLLQLSNFASAWDLLPCDKCTTFHLLRELLHLGLHQGFEPNAASIGAASVRNLRKRKGVISSITTKTKKRNDNNLDSILLSLFAHLPETVDSYSHKVIKIMNGILDFDHAETVTRVRFISDAQKLVDLLDYIIHAKDTIHVDTRHKASLLALEIFARVPVVPLSYFLHGYDQQYYHTYIKAFGAIHIEVMSQTIFANRILDRCYVIPVLGEIRASVHGDYLKMNQWRRKSVPSSETIIQIMLRLAKAIQYLHSMGVALYHQFPSSDVFLDFNLCPKIRSLYSTPWSRLGKECQLWFSLEGNVFSFGCLFYELYTGVDIWSDHLIRRVVIKRQSVARIPDYVWQLIQRCCAEDSKNQPTIDEVVGEIEGWHSVEPTELSHPTSHPGVSCFGSVLSYLRRNRQSITMNTLSKPDTQAERGTA